MATVQFSSGEYDPLKITHYQDATTGEYRRIGVAGVGSAFRSDFTPEQIAKAVATWKSGGQIIPVFNDADRKLAMQAYKVKQTADRKQSIAEDLNPNLGNPNYDPNAPTRRGSSSGLSQGIQSVVLTTPDGIKRRVKVGSKAYDKYMAQGATESGGTIQYNKGGAPVRPQTPQMAGTTSGTAQQDIITDNVTGNQYVIGKDGYYVPYLAASPAPSNAGQVGTGFNTTNLPSTSPYSGNVSSAAASTAGASSALEAQMASYQEQLAQREREQAQNQKSLLSFLKNAPSQTEMRQDAYQEAGIDPSEYFADQKRRIAEIDTLTQEYNAQVAARDQAIAQSYDKLATNSFINNQIGQIERNAAPRLNQMSANINSKAAVLQALQGNFNEARSFVDQAVNDAVADQKFKLDLYTTMYQMNQDSIDRLDKKYSEAFGYAFTLAQREYDEAREDKQLLGELLLQNPQAGISMNDTLDQAYAKIGINPMSPERRLLEAQILNTLDNAGGGSDGASAGFGDADIEADVRADAVALLDQVDAGGMTLEQVYTRLRRLYSQSEVTDAALRSLIGYAPSMPTQQTGLQSMYAAPKATTASTSYPSTPTTSSLDGLMSGYQPLTIDSISSYLFR